MQYSRIKVIFKNYYIFNTKLEGVITVNIKYCLFISISGFWTWFIIQYSKAHQET
jgi:hypothetical protein